MAATMRFGVAGDAPPPPCPPDPGAAEQAVNPTSKPNITQRQAQASIELDFDAQDPRRVVLVKVLELLLVQPQLVDVLHRPADEGGTPLRVERHVAAEHHAI